MIRIIDHEGNGHGALAEVTRKKGVNGEKSLTGTIYTNEKVLSGVDRGWKLEFENELYAFIFALPKDAGDQIELEFDAVHEFFYDMSKSAQNNVLKDGSHTFKSYLDFIFNGTGYSYRLDVGVKAFEKQNFGQRNRLDLFYDVIGTADVEFSVNGSVVRILERVGNDLSTVVKKGFNLNELRLEKNIGNFVTYQKGFGAWNDEEDHSRGRLEVEYLSPLAEIYGKLDADPIVDERYTVKESLLERLKNNVEGSYQISVQIDMEDLTRAGYEYKQPHEGDSIMVINNGLGFQRKVRIVSYETDFDVEGNILDHRITCNSIGMVEESILSDNSIKNSIRNLQTDLETTKKQVIKSNVSADGKSTNYYGAIEPTPDKYNLSIGDTWFDSSGEEIVVRVWNGVEWRKSGADVDAIRRELEQAQKEIAEVKQTANETVDRIDGEIAGKFTRLDETISNVQSISNTAQINAQTAIGHSLDALQQASQAVANTGSLSVRVDDVENTLSIKADKTTVDDLIGIVDLQSLDIQANAEGLALKANQDTVDVLSGTVTSLGTEVNKVAGQISNRVWKTDIESAVDGIEVGGRNLIVSSQLERGTFNYHSGINTADGIPGFARTKELIKITPSSSYYFWTDMKPLVAGDRAVEIAYTLFDKNKDPIKGNGVFTNEIIIKVTEDTEYIRVRFGGNRAAPWDENTKFLLIRSTKATDWTPAPEDTDAKIEHIESEFTQKYDGITSTVSSLDGRVAQQAIRIDSITTTIQDITETVSGNTTKINQAISTVDRHEQTIANISTDLDGKVEMSQYNSLVSTVDSTIRRIGNAEGDITQIEANINGLQTTVASKASQSQVTQLSNLVNTKVTSSQVNELIKSDKTIKDTRDKNESPEWYYANYSNEIVREFKRNSTMGISGEGTYGILETIVPWSDSSGGGIKQTLTTDYSVWERSGQGYYWNSWKKTADVDWVGAQISVLSDNINLRVQKGELMSQINIEAGRTLIHSNRLYLDTQSVIFSGRAFIPSAVIQGLTADKITTGTLNAANVRVINLDFETAVGNRTEFVRTAWNNISTQVSIDDLGINVYGQNQWRRNHFNQTGIDVYAGESSYYKAGAIGHFVNLPRSTQNAMENANGRFSLGIGVNSGYDLTLGTTQGREDFFQPSINIRGENGNIEMHRPLMAASDAGYGVRIRARAPYGYDSTTIEHFKIPHSFIGFSENRTILAAHRLLTFTANQGAIAFMADYKGINMNGNSVYNNSDERLKTEIKIAEVSSLEKIKRIGMYDFTWVKNGRSDFGVIAQQVMTIAPELIDTDSNGFLSVNNTRLNMMTTHAVQELALRELNTNRIASQALQLGESNEQKIKRLEKRIEELESAA